ncbi:MAG: hypothetical protein ACFFG0_30580 [Candidatus Thorarchaeota archaeon]
MLKEIMSVIEGILAGILIWQVFIPFFFDLAKTEIGLWAYYGLFCFVIIVIAVEYKSYKENELTWLASHLFGNLID